MFEGLRRKSLHTFIAAAALMETLFNTKTTPPSSLSSIVHVDTLKNWQVDTPLSELPLTTSDDPKPNIMVTFDVINLIGWKYSEA